MAMEAWGPIRMPAAHHPTEQSKGILKKCENSGAGKQRKVKHLFIEKRCLAWEWRARWKVDTRGVNKPGLDQDAPYTILAQTLARGKHLNYHISDVHHILSVYTN